VHGRRLALGRAGDESHDHPRYENRYQPPGRQACRVACKPLRDMPPIASVSQVTPAFLDHGEHGDGGDYAHEQERLGRHNGERRLQPATRPSVKLGDRRARPAAQGVDFLATEIPQPSVVRALGKNGYHPTQ
jgi:hypothetical protein